MKLLDYIRGARKGKEARRIEWEAMSDPFLSDALEGFDQVKDDHARRVKELQKLVSTRSQAQQRHRLRNWCIAACLLVAALGSSYLLWIKAPDMVPTESMILAEEITRQDTFSPDTLPAVRPAEAEPKVERPVVAMNRTEEKMQAVHTEEMKAIEVAEDMQAELKYLAPISADKVADRVDTPLAAAKVSVSQTAPVPTTIVRGQVTDSESGEPLVGASVLAKGTTQGTVTDTDGRFTLNVQGKQLEVNYIGYDPVILKPDTTRNLLIAMNPDKQALSEVVVVAYGTARKKDLTGSVSKLKEKTTSPEPTTGWKAYQKYIKENLKRPTEGECKESKGKVILLFDIDTGGQPKNITVARSLCPDADKEAIRLVQEGPLWKQGPGKATVEVDF